MKNDKVNPGSCPHKLEYPIPGCCLHQPEHLKLTHKWYFEKSLHQRYHTK